MERLLRSCRYKQDSAVGKAGTAAHPALKGVITETESLAHRRCLSGSLRMSRKGKIDTRLEFLKMKWELETSKTGILVLNPTCQKHMDHICNCRNIWHLTSGTRALRKRKKERSG